MSPVRAKIYREHAPMYGDDEFDPWPGDISLGWSIVGTLRFDGQLWRSLKPKEQQLCASLSIAY